MLFRTLARIVPLIAAAAHAAPASAQCLDSLSLARERVAAVAAGGRVLFAGGRAATGESDAVEILDVASGTWSGAHLSAPRAGVAATAVGQRVLLGGGSKALPQLFSISGSNVVDVYDLGTGAWSSQQLSRGRWGLAAATAGQVAIFAGGSRTNGPPFPPMTTVDLYDAATDTWSTADLASARRNLAATSVGDVALFAGGLCYDGASCVGNSGDVLGFSPDVDLYDAATGQWSQASLSLARYDLAATSVAGLALFAGGIGPNGLSAVVDIWDRASGHWRTASLSQARTELVAFTVGGYAVFAGGDDGQGPSTVVDVYEAATDTWHVIALAAPRAAGAAVVAGDEALIGGGRDAVGLAASVERLLGGLATSYADGASGCPCGNAGVPPAGCANSTGSGAVLALGCALGVPVPPSLVARDLVPLETAVLFAGTLGSLPSSFGDGLLGPSGSLRRLGARAVGAAGDASWPQAVAGAGAPGGPWTGGAVRYVQVWYRDSASPCGAGFNATNALQAVLWP